MRVVAAAGLVCPSHNPIPWVQVAPGRGGFYRCVCLCAFNGPSAFARDHMTP